MENEVICGVFVDAEICHLVAWTLDVDVVQVLGVIVPAHVVLDDFEVESSVDDIFIPSLVGPNVGSVGVVRCGSITSIIVEPSGVVCDHILFEIPSREVSRIKSITPRNGGFDQRRVSQQQHRKEPQNHQHRH